MGEWRIAKPDELMHYASKYYDPVAAHEYYEQHKQLKGRTSTAGINEEGRKIASNVKKNINEEKKSSIASAQAKRDSTSKAYTEQMNNKISLLQQQINAMSPANRKQNKLRFQRMIQALRDENAKRREALSAQYKSSAASIKSQADEKYISELDKIRSEYSTTKSTSGSGGIRTNTSREEKDEIMKKLAKKK